MTSNSNIEAASYPLDQHYQWIRQKKEADLLLYYQREGMAGDLTTAEAEMDTMMPNDLFLLNQHLLEEGEEEILLEGSTAAASLSAIDENWANVFDNVDDNDLAASVMEDGDQDDVGIC